MRLHAVEAGEAGGGEPVGLLHGLFGAAQNWGTVQKRLAAAPGRGVIALDLRNHGSSPRAPAMGYPAMAEDVAETLAALGALPAAVVGHSMGGKAAMALALSRPGAVAQPGIRAFLLQTLRLGAAPPWWRLGLDGIAAAMPAIEGFPEFAGTYAGPTLFLVGERSDYVRAEHHARIRTLFPAARL